MTKADTNHTTSDGLVNFDAVLKPGNVAQVLATWDRNLDATRNVIAVGATALAQSFQELRAVFVANTQEAATEAECVAFAEDWVATVAEFDDTEKQLEATMAMIRSARSRLMMVGLA